MGHVLFLVLALLSCVVGMTFVDPTDGGGISTQTLAGGSAILILNGPGRLQKLLVTTTLAATWTFYDSTSLTPASLVPVPTIVGILESGTVAGTELSLQMPCHQGIVAVPSSSAAGEITASFNGA
jgi:hypothetical protein